MTTNGSKVVVEGLAERLQERILSGEIATGTWLRQERIADEYGVSRTPVREALRALQAQGVVDVVPHRGALVLGPTLRAIREAYAVRAQLEGYAAELAAAYIRDDHLERLRDAEELFRRSAIDAPGDASGERPRWSEANDLFHEVVLQAAGNTRLTQTIASLHRSFPRNVTWSALAGSRHLLQENVDQHREVLRAITERDPVAARTAMATHVSRAGELVARRFEQLQDSPA